MFVLCISSYRPKQFVKRYFYDEIIFYFFFFFNFTIQVYTYFVFKEKGGGILKEEEQKRSKC